MKNTYNAIIERIGAKTYQRVIGGCHRCCFYKKKECGSFPCTLRQRWTEVSERGLRVEGRESRVKSEKAKS